MSIWSEKREQVNALVLELQQKPEGEMMGYALNAAGILNAYREGDVLFDDAVAQLEEWAIKYAAQQSVQSDGLTASQKEEVRQMIQSALDTGSA